MGVSATLDNRPNLFIARTADHPLFGDDVLFWPSFRAFSLVCIEPGQKCSE